MEGGAKEMGRDADKADKAVDSVTDYYEERDGIDSSKVDLSSFSQSKEQALLASVVVREEDIATLVEELEVSKVEAESMLRRNGGSAERTLIAFVRGASI
jgi:hypothetical protein